MGLLAAEMTARTGRDPNQIYASATQDLGKSFYERIDAPATPAQRTLLADLDLAHVDAQDLAGEPIEAKLSRAPGNNAAIGGTQGGRTERLVRRPAVRNGIVYKIYAESFRSEEHLRQIQGDAQVLVARLFGKAETWVNSEPDAADSKVLGSGGT